jgi:hypothetical protein
MTCPDGFWCLQFKDFLTSIILMLTIIVMYLAPLNINRKNVIQNENGDVRKRRMEILSGLMKTRKIFLSTEHVMALNSIQLEFHDIPQVITAYKEYIRLRNSDHENANDRFFESVDAAFFELVWSIANCLGVMFDKSDLSRFSYAPQGWANDETQLKEVRRLMIEVMAGRSPVYVINTQPPVQDPRFPPPPI